MKILFVLGLSIKKWLNISDKTKVKSDWSINSQIRFGCHSQRFQWVCAHQEHWHWRRYRVGLWQIHYVVWMEIKVSSGLQVRKTLRGKVKTHPSLFHTARHGSDPTFTNSLPTFSHRIQCPWKNVGQGFVNVASVSRASTKSHYFSFSLTGTCPCLWCMAPVRRTKGL